MNKIFGWVIFAAALAGSALLRADPAAVASAKEDSIPFTFQSLSTRAQSLSTHPYAARPSPVPAWLLHLNYDQYRDIRFVPAESWWRRAGLPFELQFIPPGFIFSHTVGISEVDGGRAKPIPFSPQLFNYGKNTVGELPAAMGFAGFKILYPLNKPGDELGAFQGASYFRLLCRNAVYGLSARGLAINAGGPDREEFPDFEEFWIERPARGAREIAIDALLDGPSVAGAYRFVIVPGDDTVAHVRAVLYFRKNPAVPGFAPLTSMFWHGKNTDSETDDIRPEVHDSDGLMLHTGADEWIWRPLTNPAETRVAAFADDNPRGFGLMQRERRFDAYQDLETAYQKRPSAWVEPVGKWGPGSVRLVELPTPDETNDNIVAFWVPAKLPAPGQAVEFDYDLHWCLDQIKPPAGFAVATRCGRSMTHETDLERFTIDFDGAALQGLAADPAVEAVVTVGANATLANATAQKNPYNGTWRAALALRPDGSGRPVELRCYLKKGAQVLTETWSYLWQPHRPDGARR